MTTNPLSKRRTAFLIFSVACAFIVWGLLVSLQPAFYPTEAEKKGARPSQYGFVFGIVSLSSFIFSPIFAKWGNNIGPKLLYNIGGFTQGLGGILFGLLEYVNNTTAFISLSYILRFIEGIASVACSTAILGILMEMYPTKVARISATTEMFLGLGYMIGPAVGSLLYSVGGFGLPFYLVGTIGILFAICLVVAIPNVKKSSRVIGDEETSDPEAEVGKKSLKLGTVLKSLALMVPYIDNFLSFCGNGMIESMLEPHIKDAGGSQRDVAITFLLLGGMYMIATPFVGQICDRIAQPTLIAITANVLMGISFLFIGPAPFFSFGASVSLIYGMVSIIGSGYAMTLVSSFARSHRTAMRKGYKDDMETYLVLTGMWSCSFNLGNFVGPTASGFMVEYWGFQNATLFFVAIYAVMFCINLFDILYYRSNLKKKQEYEEIL